MTSKPRHFVQMCSTWWLWKFKLCKLIKLQYNLVSAMVPWIKRGHAPQFCDEILNFQCCMTSFSHLVTDLLNVRYIPQFWDEMTKFQCCKTSLPHIGAHIHTLFWKQCNVSRWLKLVVWVTDLNCIFTTMVEVACMDHLQLHPNPG